MILSDNPTTKDYFGYSSYATALANIITQLPKDQTPFTIGIFGEWGSGKTSLMKMIEEQVGYRRNGDKGIKTIWFNPWKYDNKEAIWSALIQTILSEMAKDDEYLKNKERGDRKKILKNAKKFACQFAWYVAELGVKHLTNGVLDSKIIKSIKNVFTSSDEVYDFVNKFEDSFGKLTEEYAGERGKIAVFIDDLDRCIPENAITVLESLKLYLDKSKCVFIIGADRNIVEKGICFRYGGQIDLSGKDYLEKVIQLPFVIPPISEDKLKESLNDGKNGLGRFIDRKDYNEKFETLLIQGTKQNPRTLKRFINCFYLIKDLSNLKESIALEILGKILLIQMRFPNFYQYIVTQPEAIYKYAELVQHPDEAVRKLETMELKAFMQQTKQIPCNEYSLVNDIIHLTKCVTHS